MLLGYNVIDNLQLLMGVTQVECDLLTTVQSNKLIMRLRDFLFSPYVSGSSEEIPSKFSHENHRDIQCTIGSPAFLKRWTANKYNVKLSSNVCNDNLSQRTIKI